jgi:signal peptidase II
VRYRLLLTTAAIVAGADALTKAIAAALSRWMPLHLPGGWALQVKHNHGVILGLGAGTRIPDIFAVVAVLQITYLLLSTRNECGPLWAVALGLLAGGMAGNVGEDRIFGYVVDWIRPPDVPIVFDLADVAIAIGQVLLILLILSARTGRVRARPAVAR